MPSYKIHVEVIVSIDADDIDEAEDLVVDIDIQII